MPDGSWSTFSGQVYHGFLENKLAMLRSLSKSNNGWNGKKIKFLAIFCDDEDKEFKVFVKHSTKKISINIKCINPYDRKDQLL